MSGNDGWDDDNTPKSNDVPENTAPDDGWDDEDLLTGSHALAEEAQRIAREVDTQQEEPLPPTYRPGGSGWGEGAQQAADDLPAEQGSAEDTQRQTEFQGNETGSSQTGEQSAGSTPPAPFATPSMMPPPKEYTGDESALSSHHSFRRETFRLARSRDFLSIAALHEAALQRAQWAQTAETQANLLLDLARLYQDKLSDQARTLQTYERLVSVKPGHRDAMDYLRRSYEASGNMRALHDLYARAVDSEWAPDRRVALTREAARIALERLQDPTLAAKDWEHLLDLGEMDGQVTVELSRVYRQAQRWSDLGRFLQNRAEAFEHATRTAILREAAEAFLSGARDPDAAELIVEKIVETGGPDPISTATSLLVKKEKSAWNDLHDLALAPMENVDDRIKVDLLRLAASLLLQGQQYELASDVFDGILKLLPDDEEAWKEKEEQQRRDGNFARLVELLVARAERVAEGKQRAAVLAEAAEIAAEKLQDFATAERLWKEAIQSNPDEKTYYERLESVCEQNGNTEGMTEALEGLLEATDDPNERKQVLRRLGKHYAYRVKDDERAQKFWLELASTTPEDREVRQELNEIHRRRKDFVALDRALCHQQWHTTNRDEALELSLEIARNLVENLQDKERSVRGWQHVLDLEPSNREALDTLAELLTPDDPTTIHAAALETSLELLEPDHAQERLNLALQIASFWEKRNDEQAAIAAFERARAWQPSNPQALDGLMRLYGSKRMSAAISVLEVASVAMDSRQRARQVLERALELIPEDQPKLRFFLLARLMKLSPIDGIGEIVEAATSAEIWEHLASLYERLYDREQEPSLKRTLMLRAAQVAEEHLGDASRAFVTRQALSLHPPSDDDLTELRRLAEATQRWEDLMGLLQAAMQGDIDHEQRQKLLLERARIAEQKLQAPKRAFFELQRLIESGPEARLDATEKQALQEMHRLAEEHGLYEELLWFYGILWDRAASDEERLKVAHARRTILKDHLHRPEEALEQWLLILRLLPTDENVLAEVMNETGEQDAWGQTVPVIEGIVRAHSPGAERLRFLANLHQQRAQLPRRSVELLSQAIVLDPADEQTEEQLWQQAEQVELWPRVAFGYRLAAAKCTDQQRAQHLSHRVAGIYRDKIGDEHRHLDVERWILQRWPNDRDALETVIDYHRKAGEYDELKERLEQWVEQLPEQGDGKERWLEIARICRDQLNDTSGQLVAFSHVLELDPDNEEAKEAIAALGDTSLSPALRAKQVRLELARAEEQNKGDLLEKLADIELEMGNIDAAIEALSEQFELGQTGREATRKLLDLLQKQQRWEQLIDTLEQAAEREQEASEKQRLLEEAVKHAENHDLPAERLEKLLRRLLEVSDSARKPFVMLVRVLRQAGRWEELAAVLRERIDNHASEHDALEVEHMKRSLVRLLALGLGKKDEAEKLLRERQRREGPKGDVSLWLATMALEKGDHNAYLELRRKQALEMPDRLCALVLCHLAEHCDQFVHSKGRILAFYREARNKDPQNTLANEGLRGLGRGVKNWRTAAALLPVPKESTLDDKQRAERLRTMGMQARDSDPLEARGWFERAVAVDPNDVASWDALTSIGIERREYDYALLTARQALLAYERTTSPMAESDLKDHAQRLARVAGIAHMARDEETASGCAQLAFDEYPQLPAAAMLVADAKFEQGKLDEARSLYGQLLDEMGDSLTAIEKSHVLQRRALGHLRAGRLAEARRDVEQALELRPLFPLALDTMAEVLRRQGRPVLSVVHELRALLVTEETLKRGAICAHIGRLCDEELGRTSEGGAWYELAVESGVDDKQVMRRVLQHFRDTGRAKQALVAIADLIENTTDSAELAELWAMRGAILLDDNLEKAEEALDVALSFDPSHRGAHQALRQVLERKGEYDQLMALLDARAEAGDKEERIEALEQLVRLSFEQVNDPERGEQYLKRLVELAPQPKYVRQLLEIVQRDPERQDERLPILAKLLELGDETSGRIMEIGRILNADGKHHWAWSVMSSLMGATPVDPWVKTALSEYRRSYEKFDSVALLRPFLLETLGALPEPSPVVEALKSLAPRVFPQALGKASRIDARTGPGRILQRVLEGLTVDVSVYRVSSQEQPMRVVLSEDGVELGLRSDLLAAPPGELSFLFAYGLTLARPVSAPLAAVPPRQRGNLLDALAWAVGYTEPESVSEAVALLKDAISEQSTEEERSEWLAAIEQDWKQARGEAFEFWAAIERAALRVACIAAGDSRTAMRAIARIEQIGRPPGVTRLEEFDRFFASSRLVREALAFIASDMFSRILTASA